MSHQHDEAVFSYSGCLSFDGKGNVTLSVEDFNRLLGRDGYACRLELEAGRLRTALAASEAALASERNANNEGLALEYDRRVKAESDLAALRARLAEVEKERDEARAGEAENARIGHSIAECGRDIAAERDSAIAAKEKAEGDLDRMTLHYAEVLHDARGKQDAAAADLAAARAEGPRTCKGDCHVTRTLRGERDEALAWWNENRTSLETMNNLRADATRWGGLAGRFEARAISAEADAAALREVLTEVLAASRSTYHLEEEFGPLIARATALSASPCAAKTAECEGCRPMREALAVYANPVHWDNDDDDDQRRCFVWLCHDDEVGEYGGSIARTALSASPCEAKGECEGCKRMRGALGRAYADCRVLAHSYKHDSRPPGEIVKRCLALPVNVMEAVDALSASPCDAKVECEGCKGLRTALEVRETLIAKLREPTEEHRRWVALMDGTPEGTTPMTVYRTKDGVVIVCGDPSDEPDDADECRHNCDAMGCTTFSHVLLRGSVESFWAMCETAASAMLDEADALAAPKGGEVGK